MPADAKLGLFLGICLVVVAAWVYRPINADKGRNEGAHAPLIEPAIEPVLIPNASH